MKKLNDAKKSVLGNMILRQTMGGLRKEDRIKDKDELKGRITEEYKRQNSKTTHKLDLNYPQKWYESFLYNIFGGISLLLIP